MLAFILYLFSSLHLLTSTNQAYTPIDDFRLNCGWSLTTTSPDDGRSWDGDARSKFSQPITDASPALTASEQDPSVVQVPFMTARVFQSQFTYTFPVSTGPKFLRLYFYPATYSNFNKSASFFSVAASTHTLLHNYSAFLDVSAMRPRQASLIKEFVVNVGDNQRLNITFIPSPDSYAFVNGIEVVSMPSNLYMRGEKHPVPLVSSLASPQTLVVDNNTALETLYRLNVGGNDVQGRKDTGMYRMWRQDDPYIYGEAFGVTPHLDVPILYNDNTPNYTAPEIVYTTSRTMGKDQNFNLQYNLTWTFAVYSGFRYLVRLHFCEFQQEVTLERQRIFEVLLNNQTADPNVDVIHLSGGSRVPVFKDYIVQVPLNDGLQKKQDLWLVLHPRPDLFPRSVDALLNGLEIFKLNNSEGSLAGPNPDPVLDDTPEASNPKSPRKSKSRGLSPGLAVLASILGGVIAASILGFLIFRHRKKVRDSSARPRVPKSSWDPFSYTSKSSKTSASSLPSDLCRHFSLSQIKSATSNFSDDNLIGTGGYGNVYKGYIDNGSITVAIKRSNPSSNQGAREFHTEIQMLSKLRHLHLVSLIGYCDDDGEMILVYEYMANGTLRDHLYNTNKPPLPWKLRLQICIGAARGLHYLHTGAKHTIIHRDVKSTNILLDDKWAAKVSDFGLSKLGPENVTQSHVSTAVKGSFGYVDPEYYRRQQLTEKSDVYSFGVVLLEVLCARAAVVTTLPREQVSLAAWGRHCWRKGAIDRIMDPHLKGQVAAECLTKFGEVIDGCLQDNGTERPAMSDVVWGLEFALQLQEAAEKNSDGNAMMGPSFSLLSQVVMTDEDDTVFWGSTSGGTSTEERAGSSVDSYNRLALRSSTVFSEIKSPEGR